MVRFKTPPKKTKVPSEGVLMAGKLGGLSVGVGISVHLLDVL